MKTISAFGQQLIDLSQFGTIATSTTVAGLYDYILKRLDTRKIFTLLLNGVTYDMSNNKIVKSLNAITDKDEIKITYNMDTSYEYYIIVDETGAVTIDKTAISGGGGGGGEGITEIDLTSYDLSTEYGNDEISEEIYTAIKTAMLAKKPFIIKGLLASDGTTRENALINPLSITDYSYDEYQQDYRAVSVFQYDAQENLKIYTIPEYDPETSEPSGIEQYMIEVSMSQQIIPPSPIRSLNLQGMGITLGTGSYTLHNDNGAIMRDFQTLFASKIPVALLCSQTLTIVTLPQANSAHQVEYGDEFTFKAWVDKSTMFTISCRMTSPIQLGVADYVVHWELESVAANPFVEVTESSNTFAITTAQTTATINVSANVSKDKYIRLLSDTTNFVAVYSDATAETQTFGHDGFDYTLPIQGALADKIWTPVSLAANGVGSESKFLINAQYVNDHTVQISVKQDV